MVSVWWVYAADDDRQHGSLSIPPPRGGPFHALCAHEFTAPPGSSNNYRAQGVKPFCERCLIEYCLVPSPAPIWCY